MQTQAWLLILVYFGLRMASPITEAHPPVPVSHDSFHCSKAGRMCQLLPHSMLRELSLGLLCGPWHPMRFSLSVGLRARFHHVPAQLAPCITRICTPPGPVFVNWQFPIWYKFCRASHSFKILTEYLLCARHSFKYWKYIPWGSKDEMFWDGRRMSNVWSPTAS